MVQVEKLVNPCDMELMKMAMLRHEQTFRQQVHELHRLYRVQKQLMTSGGLWRPSSELISCRRQQVRRGRQPRRALGLGLRLPADDHILVARADNATATPPSPREEDGLELTLAVGSGGASSRRKRQDESTGTGTALRSDCSGGSLTSTSSSTDTASGSPPHRRAMPAFRLQEGAAAVMKQPQPRSPWLVQCPSLKMA
ncbi:uncharacterized protein C2845_PM01G35410 [Panicum miliaceum]|uniref:Uncharacterized protein n=1 Tax=Panicum miliaceum TaxID=4540 RepID=A0A3L6TGY6_PANMI|nr:uncharacterized protein C2845_PM01G35410 [Panicum miliaceum]